MTKINWFVETVCVVKTTTWITLFLHLISNETQRILWHSTTLKLFSATVTPLPLAKVALIHPAWE